MRHAQAVPGVLFALLLPSIVAPGCGGESPPSPPPIEGEGDPRPEHPIPVDNGTLPQPGASESGSESVPVTVKVPTLSSEQATVVEDLKYDLAGLEWFLQDQEMHRKSCRWLRWDQPSIDVYREEPRSYLPEGCEGEEKAEEAAAEHDAPRPLPKR